MEKNVHKGKQEVMKIISLRKNGGKNIEVYPHTLIQSAYW